MAVTKIPVDKLHHVSVVVKDVKQATRDYAEVYGINQWAVLKLSPGRLTNTAVRGHKAEHSFTLAMGQSSIGDIAFALVQPTGGESIVQDFQYTNGEGINAICVAEVQPDQIEDVKDFFAREDIRVAQFNTLDNLVDIYHFDTRKALGGYYIEILVPKVANWRELIQPDEVYDYSGEQLRPAGVDPLPVPGVNHFGVVVHDVREAGENYARLFGIDQWRFMNWRTEPGWLEEPTYNGGPVNHAYFTTSAQIANFGFEVIQPTFGPSHYKEDYLQVYGPGIHHMNLVPLKLDEDWQRVKNWMGSLDKPAPVCMSGGLRFGAADFYYLDTRAKLHGYVTESVCPRPLPPGVTERPRFAPDFMVDYSQKASV